MYKLKRLIIIVFISLIYFSAALEGSDKKFLIPVKIEGQIIIDGKLIEENWQKADIGQKFIQYEPLKGKPANFKTQIRILYNNTHIYFGIKCFDPEPGKIVANLTKRDSDLEDDDSIGIGLDTFMDQRTAYYFFTNALGTQADGRLADNGRTADSTWDSEWESAAYINSHGWTAEFAIPLAVLKYNPGENLSWGLGLVRSIPRNLEKDTWTGPVEAYTRVSQFGILKNLNLKKARKKLEVIPHFVTRLKKGEDKCLCRP